MVKKLKLLALSCALIPGAIFAQIQSFGAKGHIDWNAKTISAKGIGAPNPNMPAVTARPMAIQAARSDALRNALEIIKGIQVTSTTTVENYMVSSDLINKSVQGFIRTYSESEPKYMADKTIEITVTIPLDENVQEALLPREVGSTPKSHSSTGKGAHYTGLIIDARGLKVMPAIAPAILDEEGKEIYGSAYVSRSFATKWGMAGYAKTPEQAKKMVDRLGKAPGLVKAKAVKGASKTDLVVSNVDARDIEAAASTMKFLSDCRVVIIVD